MKIPHALLLLILISIISSPALSDEMATRSEIRNNAKSLFFAEQFKELDRLSEKYRKNEERTSSGLWKLTIFYYGLNKALEGEAKDKDLWDSLLEKSNKWINTSPTSPAAYITKGIILNNYAWSIRGGTFAHKVPKEAWKPFKEMLKLAKLHMLSSKKIASSDPHWYEITARILTGLNNDNHYFLKHVNEGLDKYPKYYELYFAAITHLAPRWHGDKNQIESFANDAVSRTKTSEGMGMYARIYWYASQTHYDEKLFLDSNVVWEKMREGIKDVIKDYPDSWNIQNFAFFSCLAKDKETTHMLFEKMTKPMIKKAWKRKEYYDRCKLFAHSN